MNVEIGTDAAPFPEKECISGIFLAVWEAWSVMEAAKWHAVPAGLVGALTCEILSTQSAGSKIQHDSIQPYVMNQIHGLINTQKTPKQNIVI